MFYILIPVYNTEKYLKQCLDSIVAQTYPHFEAIVVNDGSMDASGIICDAYAKKDSRIHVIHKSNEGLISARRTAIDYVQQSRNTENGYFLFLDSDDYFELNALERIAETIRKNRCDLVVFDFRRVMDGKILFASGEKSFAGEITDKRLLYKLVFQNWSYNSLCRKAIKCNLLKCLDYSDYYHIRYGEDLLQSIPVYRDCKKAVFISDVLYNYTVNPESMTHKPIAKRNVADSTVRTEVWRFLESENVFNEQDKREYLEQCGAYLKNTILDIAQAPEQYEVITDLFDKIKQDSYYSMLLEKNKNNCILAWLKDGKYNRIIFYGKVRRTLARINHLVKDRSGKV